MMKSILPLTLLFSLLLTGSPAAAQSREDTVVDDSRAVLSELTTIPARGIPASLLANAQGLVIVPDLLKGGFVVGIRHGRGVALVRDERGQWRPPIFVSLTGGSVGYQIGVQATDIVLVFKSRNGVNGLLSGKFTLGADAAAAAGPVGREMAAATDGQFQAEILTYSRSRGLFAGVSLDGSVLQTDPSATGAYYAGTNVLTATPGQQPATVPASAGRLLDTVARLTTAPGYVPTAASVPAQDQPTPAAGGAAPVAPQVAAPALNDREFRQRLATASRQLDAMLDNGWKTYLALPPEVFSGDRSPSSESLSQALERFNTVARDPRYRALSQRAEFQATFDLLWRYTTMQSSRNQPTLALPPPPGVLR